MEQRTRGRSRASWMRFAPPSRLHSSRCCRARDTARTARPQSQMRSRIWCDAFSNEKLESILRQARALTATTLARRRRFSMKTILVVLALGAVTLPLRAANGVTPGQFVIEPATLICLGFEWDITGDENRNSTVEVNYR